MYGIINIAGKQCSCSSFHLIGHVLVFHLQILSQGTALNSKTDHHKKVVTFSLFLIWMVIRCNAFKTASSVVFLWGRELVSENPFNTVSVEVLVGELSDFSWSEWRFQKKITDDQWCIVFCFSLGGRGLLAGPCKSSYYFVIGRICKRLKPTIFHEEITRARRDLVLKPCPNIIFFLRLRPGTTLFEKLPPRTSTSTLRRGVKPSCSCVKKGNRRFNTCDVKPLPDIERGGKPVKPIKVPPKPRKPGRNDNRDYDPGSVNYVFKPPKVKYRKPSFPTATGITRQKALAHCKKTLRQNSVARACSKFVRKKEASLIKECMTDIMVWRSYDITS